ncbi:MAG: carboxylesterase family protein [Lachnospiraceae bacterium]|nr:carboxylesterase family protein [Lachnospiraceae bacterium]
MIKKAAVEGGIVVGASAADPRIISFKGIPFAAPPVGENRWRAPQPVIPWEGEKECFVFKPISMQHIPGLDQNNIYTREWNVDPTIEMSEDCLYLNVWTPAKTAEEKLPVFVWYFGGGLQEGNPAEMEFDGERLARRGIVVVTVNYRLNVFGFLAHPQLTREQPDAPTNFGHLDQQAGTRWVKRNIAAFGGDPDNITIGGQSAGGGSVLSQLVSPQNEGLFQKAAVISGIMFGIYPSIFGGKSIEENEKIGEAFFERLGVKTLEEARALDAFYIRDKLEENRVFFGTSIDGQFSVGSHEEMLTKGKYWHIPILFSRTSTEFMGGMKAESMEQFKENVKAWFGSYADEMLALCGTDDLDKANAASTLSGIDLGVRAVQKRKEELGIDDPVYYGVFDPSIPGWDDPKTFHSSDLWFWFETLAKCWRPFKGFHYDLARNMCNYMTNFVKTGNPNGEDADGTPMPEWKPFTTADPEVIWFKDTGSECEVNPPAEITQIVQKALLEKYPL